MASGEQIYRWFKEGRIGPLEYAAREIVALAEEFETDADGLDAANKKMMGYWEGEGADAASKGMGPLIDGHQQSAPMVVDAGRSVDDQGSLLNHAKHSVVEVPPEPSEPSPWARAASVILPGTPDPDVSYRDGMNQHNDANATNVRVMDQYGVGTGGTRSSLPSDYGIMADDGAAIHIGSTSASSVSGLSGSAPAFGGASGIGGGGAGGFGGGVGPGPNFGGGLPGGGTSGVGPGPTLTPSPTPGPAPGPPPGGGGLPVRPGPGPMPIAAPVGRAPVGGDDGERRSGRTAAGRPTAGSSRAGARMAGTGVGAPKPGSNTVVRGGGAGASARLAGGNAGLQAGKGAGIGVPGSGAGGATAAKAAGGLGGRPGAGGMAGGAGAGRGQGSEDDEHKDKYAIKEELDDGLQIQYDELGAKTIDEKTGNTVVSPVIGEPEYKPDADPNPGN